MWRFLVEGSGSRCFESTMVPSSWTLDPWNDGTMMLRTVCKRSPKDTVTSQRTWIFSNTATRTSDIADLCSCRWGYKEVLSWHSNGGKWYDSEWGNAEVTKRVYRGIRMEGNDTILSGVMLRLQRGFIVAFEWRKWFDSEWGNAEVTKRFYRGIRMEGNNTILSGVMLILQRGFIVTFERREMIRF